MSSEKLSNERICPLRSNERISRRLAEFARQIVIEDPYRFERLRVLEICAREFRGLGAPPKGEQRRLGHPV